MDNEYRLSYTAAEINNKLGEISNAVHVTEQTLTDAQKAQARQNIGAEAAVKSRTIGENVVSFSAASAFDSATVTTDSATIASGTGVTFRMLGKNLIPYPYTPFNTIEGITVKDNGDGTLTVNGMAAVDSYLSLTDSMYLPAGKYVISGYPTKTYAFATIVCVYTDGNVEYNTIGDDVITIDRGAGCVLGFVLRGGVVFDNVILKPQIEVYKGFNEPTEFEAFKVGDYVHTTIGAQTSFAPLFPNTTLCSFTDGITVEVLYNRNINAAVSELEKAVYNIKNPALTYGLPVLYLNGNTSAMTKENAVTLNYIYGERSGTCTCKWQGTSSLAYPKKNYTVKFDNAFEASAGWGEHTKYCLKANYIDFSHMRNVCSAKLWGAIVKSRTVSNATLNALPNGGAIDGFPICVVINDKYVGLYTLCIPKDGWMMGMGTGNNEAIVCANGSGTYANRFKGTSDTLSTSFDIEYVSDENDAAWVETSLNRLIQACVDSDGTDLDTTIAQYLDWDSAIDYFIYTTAICNFDGINHNYLLATYDGVKWFFTPYDLDSTFGNDWTGTWAWRAWTMSPYDLSTNHRVFDLIYTYKMPEVVARWTALSGGALDVEELIYNITKYCAQIPKALYDEECKIWNGIPGTSFNNLSQITEWYYRRHNYLKQWIALQEED